MNKLRTMLCAACTLMLANINSYALADSGNLAGPYIALQASSVGMGAMATQQGGADDVNENTTVNAGRTGIVAGAEVGYAVPLGEHLLLDVGVSYIDGAAVLKTQSTDLAAVDDVKVVISDFVTYYIAPTVMLTDTSALYVKIAYSEADVNVSGDISNPGDLDGDTYAIGMRTVLPSGLFVRAEAGMTDYQNVISTGKGTAGGIPTTTSYHADPKIAFGAISLGFRF